MSTASLRNTCKIQTSWDMVENKDITDAVVYRFEDEEDENRSPACPCGLYLRTPCAVGVAQGCETNQSEAHCTVTVSQAEKGRSCVVSAVDVLCSARFMELYSGHGEYLCTSEGVRIDGEIVVSGLDSDQKLYCLQHSFDPPVVSVTLKFLGLAERDRLWLHSLHVTVTGQAASSGHSVASLMSSAMGTSVDWGKVRELTSDVTVEIPERGRQLWDSVEATQKNRELSVGPLQAALTGGSGAASMPPMMAAMMSMFAGMNSARQSGSRAKVSGPSVAMTTGSETETKRSPTVKGAVSEVIVGNHSSSQTLEEVSDSGYHGNVAHRTFVSESTGQSNACTGLTAICVSTSASPNSACIGNSTSESQNNAGDSASSVATTTSCCVHCIERQTRELREFEERLKRHVSEMETRIVAVLGERIDDAQRKTQDKLDAILRHLTAMPSPRCSGASDNSISLD